MPQQLPSVRIDQLPDGVLRQGDFLVFRDMATGVTRRVLADSLIPSQTTQNFQWQTDNEYDQDEIVTYGGTIWQSTINGNINIVPGTNPDLTDPAPWIQIPQGSDGWFWTAGAYTSDQVLKYSDYSGTMKLYELVNNTRPYNSVDLAAEVISGDWVSVFDTGGGGTFASDVTFILSGGKSFGKYLNGNLAPWNGLTAIEAIIDAAIEYISPILSLLGITGQPTIVERGTILSGSKTFTWSYSANSGMISLVDIYDITAASTLLANTANDGSQAQVITTKTMNTENGTQQWRLVGHNTSPVGDVNSNSFTVTAKLKFWYAPVSGFPINSAGVRALADSDWYDGNDTFILNTGTVNSKFVFAQKAGHSWSVIDLDALNANISSDYILVDTFNVQDAGGINESYDVIGMTTGAPYSENHRHQITLIP